jgi:hypothetical protein
MMEEREHATITDIHEALTHATNDQWRDWYAYIDKLLDAHNEATHGTPNRDLVN